MISSVLCMEGHGIFCSVLAAIKDIIHYRTSNDPDHEALRSTVISACYGPEVPSKFLSQVPSIYRNINYMKLDVYRRRRDTDLAGETTHMMGEYRRCYEISAGHVY